MVRTIQISACMSVQGPVIRSLGDGRVVIRVQDRTYEGVPLAATRTPAAAAPHA
jgi:hypothetical protein